MCAYRTSVTASSRAAAKRGWNFQGDDSRMYFEHPSREYSTRYISSRGYDSHSLCHRKRYLRLQMCLYACINLVSAIWYMHIPKYECRWFVETRTNRQNNWIPWRLFRWWSLPGVTDTNRRNWWNAANIEIWLNSRPTLSSRWNKHEQASGTRVFSSTLHPSISVLWDLDD